MVEEEEEEPSQSRRSGCIGWRLARALATLAGWWSAPPSSSASAVPVSPGLPPARGKRGSSAGQARVKRGSARGQISGLGPRCCRLRGGLHPRALRGRGRSRCEP